MAVAAGGLIGERYRVLELVGSGATGEVHRTVDPASGEPRALKLLRAELAGDAESRARFLDAAKLASQLTGPHVAPVLDFGVDGKTGQPFLVMPLFEGESLLARLERAGPLPVAEARRLGHELALGLEHIHAHGVVHRDVKPSNVFLVARGPSEPPRVELLDFGLAKLMAPRGQRADTTRNHGTPAYMAPEQMRGEGDIDARADLYSVGHVMFHALVGQAYWQPELHRTPNLLRLVRSVSRGLPERATVRAERCGVRLPARFDAWFERATAPHRALRHESAREQAAELEAALAPAP
jgi:serine/threonine-protein kinase